MISKRRLSDAFDDVQARVGSDRAERKGLLSGLGHSLEEELDSPQLPGIDNMWLLLTGGENDFNPVWCVLCVCHSDTLTDGLGSASIFTFAEEVNFDGLLREWDAMSTRYPAYRQRITGLHRRFHTVRLQPDPAFDIRNHVTSVRLPADANGKQALEDAMAAFIAREWDLGQPLWEAQVTPRDLVNHPCAHMA
jgi:hypothetical protein